MELLGCCHLKVICEMWAGHCGSRPMKEQEVRFNWLVCQHLLGEILRASNCPQINSRGPPRNKWRHSWHTSDVSKPGRSVGVGTQIMSTWCKALKTSLNGSYVENLAAKQCLQITLEGRMWAWFSLIVYVTTLTRQSIEPRHFIECVGWF